MRIKIVWSDNTSTEFNNIDSADEGDSFVHLLDEDENTVVDVNISQVRYIKYD